MGKRLEQKLLYLRRQRNEIQVENFGKKKKKIVSDVFIVIDGKKNNLQDRDFENVYNLTIHHSYFSK